MNIRDSSVYVPGSVRRALWLVTRRAGGQENADALATRIIEQWLQTDQEGRAAMEFVAAQQQATDDFIAAGPAGLKPEDDEIGF